MERRLNTVIAIWLAFGISVSTIASDLTGHQAKEVITQIVNYGFMNGDALIKPAYNENPEYITIQGKQYKTSITQLNLVGLITDEEFTMIRHMTNLKSLTLADSQVSDMSALAGLANLEYLHLSNNQVSDISALSALTNLWDLSLSGNQISDISALATLTNLGRLSVSRNQVSDISVLVGVTNLVDLYLSHNEVSDISALAALTNLRNLWLENNRISNVSALVGLTNLDSISLRDNKQIVDWTSVEHLSAVYGFN